MRLEQGQIVAGYRIDGVLGEGGMGVVYEATQLSLERKVALKLISAALGDDFSFRERFRREGLIQAAIDHPNIVTVYEAGENEHGLFLAMRLIRGPSLRDLILGRELAPERTLRFLGQVADALDTAHEAGLIHRDIKPSNVLVATGPRDHAYLADFGVTKAAGEASLTRTGQLVGTIDYMAPEVIRGEPATRASDIYALGALVYECLTGTIPFPRESDAAVLYAHLFDAPPRVTQERPDLPSAIDAVVDRGMAKEPAERHATAGELALEAERALGAEVADLGVPAAVRTPEQLGVRRPEDAVSTPAAMTRPAPETREASGAPATAPAAAPPTVPAERTAIRPSRGLALWAAAAALLTVLAVAGFVAGRAGGGGETGAAASRSVRAGGLSVSVPTDWRTSRTGADVQDLGLGDAVELEAPGGAGSLFVGRVVGRGLPPRPGVPRQIVMLGDMMAFRDRNLRLGLERLDRYFVRYERGTSGLICVFGDTRVRRTCAEFVATAQPVGIKPFELTPSPGYGRALDAAFGTLTERRTAALGRLRSADTPAGQASAAAELREVHEGAVRSIGRAPAPPIVRAANDQVIAALRAAASAYDRLASAARAGNRVSFNRARKAALGAERKLEVTMTGLEQLGYAVR